MTKTEIAEILKTHSEWVADNTKGKRENLRGANLGNADLRYANLRNADLDNANLGNADLRGAYMVGVYMVGANLASADLTDANLPDYQLCPQDKTFEAYKKVRDGVVLKLRIEGPRTSSLVGRK